ncbi:MAG: GH3 auxin-responsive promoter family protein [Dehalococcoidales bacterium]|nr:GH3 auxin-responsive promoter family protein [Dehalococcoidales bacterium]
MGRFLNAFLPPWRDALVNPAEAQDKVLKNLLPIYAQTDYGLQHGTDKITDIAQYSQVFPLIDYETVKPTGWASIIPTGLQPANGVTGLS